MADTIVQAQPGYFAMLANHIDHKDPVIAWNIHTDDDGNTYPIPITLTTGCCPEIEYAILAPDGAVYVGDTRFQNILEWTRFGMKEDIAKLWHGGDLVPCEVPCELPCELPTN